MYLSLLLIGKVLEHKLPTTVTIPSMTESEIFLQFLIHKFYKYFHILVQLIYLIHFQL